MYRIKKKLTMKFNYNNFTRAVQSMLFTKDITNFVEHTTLVRQNYQLLGNNIYKDETVLEQNWKYILDKI